MTKTTKIILIIVAVAVVIAASVMIYNKLQKEKEQATTEDKPDSKPAVEKPDFKPFVVQKPFTEMVNPAIQTERLFNQQPRR